MTPHTSPDDALKLDNQLCFALYAATRAMMNTYRTLLDHLGLTFPQYLVMLVLWEVGECTVKDLGQALYLDSGTLSPLLKRLEAAGFIRRTRSSRDERAVEVSLTEAGKTLKEQAFPVPGEFNCRVALDGDEFSHLRGQLRQLAETLTNANERDALSSKSCYIPATGEE